MLLNYLKLTLHLLVRNPFFIFKKLLSNRISLSQISNNQNPLLCYEEILSNQVQ